jgi:superfamily II DNA or RNA helicase
MGKIKERDYQAEARREAFAAWARGERAHLMAAPTGAGKTLVEAKVAEAWQRREGGSVLVLAQDSRELVRQLAAAFRRHTRLSVGVEMGQERVRRDALPSVVCATVQTMSKRLADFPRSAFTLIVQDEADHAAAKSWRKISDYFWAARIFGCTATPNRHDGRRVPFDSAHRAATHQQLINGGLIAPIEVRDVRIVDRKLIVLPSGEHPVDDAAIDAIWKQEGELHEIVEPTLRLVEERPTIVFAPTVARARELAAMFDRYRRGCARAVWGDMPRAERKDVMDAFQTRAFQFIVNVGVLGRGVDLPFVSCVVMARVTQSRTVYEQAIGRGWRADPGKDRLLVLDFCENADRHRIISTVALLTGRDASEEEIERASEILDESRGGNVEDALESASRDLLDPNVCARVRAKVAVRTRTIDLLTEEITEEEWRTKSNRQLAIEHGISSYLIGTRRPLEIKSPSAKTGRTPPREVERVLSAITDQEWRENGNRELSRKYNISFSTIAGRRVIPLNRTSRSWRKMLAAISEEDWKTKTNTQISRETGVEVWNVKYHRPKGLKCTRSMRVTTRPDAPAKPGKWASLISEEDWKTKTNADIARMLGAPRTSVAYLRPPGLKSPYRNNRKSEVIHNANDGDNVVASQSLTGATPAPLPRVTCSHCRSVGHTRKTCRVWKEKYRRL